MSDCFTINIERNAAFETLSNRQKQVLYYLVRGKYSKEIARILGLSHRTIQHYTEHIKEKFNVNSRSELIEKAIGNVSLDT